MHVEVFSLFNKSDVSLTELECLKATSLLTAMIVMLADEKVAGLVRAENAEAVQKAFGQLVCFDEKTGGTETADAKKTAQ